MRKGLGINRGRGYYNLVPQDHIVHSLSAKGVKTLSVSEKKAIKKHLVYSKMHFQLAKVKKNTVGELTKNENIEEIDRLLTRLNAKGEVSQTIDTANGKAKLVSVETEDADGRWNDNFNVSDGYWVIHKGKTHLVYKVDKSLNAKGKKPKFMAGEDLWSSLSEKNRKEMLMQGLGIDKKSASAYAKEDELPVEIADRFTDNFVEEDEFSSDEYDLDAKFNIASHLKHSNVPDSKFNKVQLNKGVKVEMEHTRSKKVAKAITKAHLLENDAYYKKFNPQKKSKEYLLNAKDMLTGKKWDTFIGKDLETHTIKRELGWGKYRIAQVNLSKRNVPFEGVKYFVSAGVDEMRPIGLAKDMVTSKILRHKFQSFRKYDTAKRNVSKLKKEYRKVI